MSTSVVLPGPVVDASGNAAYNGSVTGASFGFNGSSPTVLAGATPNGTNDVLLVTGRGSYGGIQFATGGAYLSYQTGVPARTASWQAGGAAYTAHVADSFIATEGAGGGAVSNVGGTSSLSVAAGKVTLATAGGAASMSAAGAQWSGWKWVTASKTTNYTVLAADSGTVFDNAGAAASVTFTLPAIGTTLGLQYTFFVKAAFTMVVAPNAADTIVTPAPVKTPGQAVTLAATAGTTLTIIATSANTWAVTSALGTLT